MQKIHSFRWPGLSFLRTSVKGSLKKKNTHIFFTEVLNLYLLMCFCYISVCLATLHSQVPVELWFFQIVLNSKHRSRTRSHQIPGEAGSSFIIKEKIKVVEDATPLEFKLSHFTSEYIWLKANPSTAMYRCPFGKNMNSTQQ